MCILTSFTDAIVRRDKVTLGYLIRSCVLDTLSPINHVFQSSIHEMDKECASLFIASGRVDFIRALGSLVVNRNIEMTRWFLSQFPVYNDPSLVLRIVVKELNPVDIDVLRQVVQMCVSRGPSRLEFVHAALSEAATIGNVEALKEILTTGSSLVTDECKNIILYDAAYTGNFECIKLLVENGATALKHALDIVSRTPSYKGSTTTLDIIAYLITQGVKYWAVDQNFTAWTPAWTWRLWKTGKVDIQLFKQNDERMYFWIQHYQKVVNDARDTLLANTDMPSAIVDCIVDWIRFIHSNSFSNIKRRGA
jgi:hypothetical protein